MIYKDLNSTWLDEIGIKLGLPRFLNESLDLYHSRLMLQARDLPEPTQSSFLRTLSRTIGLANKPIFKITPIEISDFALKTLDLRVEIDSVFLRVWSDYKNKPDTPELEINLYERGEKYFLRDVYEELKKLDFLSLTLMHLPEWKYLKSKHLIYSNTDGFAHNVPLLEGSNITILGHKYIRKMYLQNTLSFNNEVSSSRDVVNRGDYYIDSMNGYVYSTGESVGTCDYEYSQFPFYITWQPINSIPVNDKSYSFISKDNLINENGKEERLLLNSYGAKIANKILQAHSLQWGE